MLEALALAPLAALRFPDGVVPIAAGLDELDERAVADRRGIEREGLELGRVRAPLVVVRPGLLVGAHREGPAVDLDVCGKLAPFRRRLVPERVLEAAQLEGLQHRLEV